jgi:hypothetical protein
MGEIFTSSTCLQGEEVAEVDFFSAVSRRQRAV